MSRGEYRIVAATPAGSVVVAIRHSEAAALLEAVIRQQHCDDPFVEYLVDGPDVHLPGQRQAVAS